MHKDKINLIYLMGAGRSGTTAIATFLGGHPDIQVVGEMHQFYDHLRDDLACSCGEKLKNCEFWSEVLHNLSENTKSNPSKIQELNDKVEYHSSLPKHFTGTVSSKILTEYNSYQQELFSAISKSSNANYFLDSAKYIGRNLSLRKSSTISIKTIYIVRDVRGVINSFSKNVQSSRSPLSSVFYYLTVNSAVMLSSIFMFKNRPLKIRYEDFMEKPEKSLIKIGHFLELNMNPVIEKIKNEANFEIGHIIGGNRLKINKSIKFRSDEKWKQKISRPKQIIYYLLALPIMLINRYKP